MMDGKQYSTVVINQDKEIIGYSDPKCIESIIDETVHKWLIEAYCTDNIRDVIKPGNKVVIKPNLVHEMNFRVRFDGEKFPNPNDCFITSWIFVRHIVEILSKVNNLDITVLECPLQSCNIDKIVNDDMIEELRSFNRLNTVKFVDARRTKYIYTDNVPIIKHDCRSENDYVDFNLGELSLHCKYEDRVDRFRVTDYPPSEMKKFHSKGKHIYRIAKEIIDADVVISIPKLKTHMKSGMTGAMKNFVGVVGNKECLPHHIKGSKWWGGDCYGDFSLLKALSENLMDWANSYMLTDEKKYYWSRKFALSFMLVRWLMCLDRDITGSWYGNDTICRTIVDLNRILYYGRGDGTIAINPQRKVISIVDAIVSGQDEGPMRPLPNRTGAVVISESTALADIACAELVGIDSSKVHYLFLDRVETIKYPLMQSLENASVVYNGNVVSIDMLKEMQDSIILPPRWVGRIEKSNMKRFSYGAEFRYNLCHYGELVKEISKRTKKERFK